MQRLRRTETCAAPLSRRSMKHGIPTKLALMALGALAPLCTAQSQLAGDWQGTLTAGGTPFRIVWHAAAAKDGTINSTLDNVDQNLFAILVKSTTLKDGNLTLTVDDQININGQQVNVRGVYTGVVNKNASEVKGTWTQTEPEAPPAELDLKHVSAPAAPLAPIPPPPPPPVEPAAAPVAPAAAIATSIAGDWQGSISVGPMSLRIVLHVTSARDGSLSGTLDSPDQGALGTPINAITFKDSKLSFNLNSAVPINYEGALNADGSEIHGTLTQGMPIELNFKRAAPQSAQQPAAKPAPPSDIDGTWTGTMGMGPVNLHIIFKIANTTDGLTAKLQSPDQSQAWVTANTVTRKENALSVVFNFSAFQASYEGKISADLNSIEGTFNQAGMPMPLPLALKRTKE
jgi:hypothetical protein